MKVARNWTIGVLGVAAVLATLLACGPGTAAAAKRPWWENPHRMAVNKQRALNAYDAMQRKFYDHRQNLYRGDPWAHAWPYGQVLAATIAVRSMPGMRHRYRKDMRRRLRGLQAYEDNQSSQPAGYMSKVRPPRGPGGKPYTDDNLWFGLELARAYHVHGAATLDKAKAVFAMVGSHWDQRQNVPCPGGVIWAPGISGDRNTVSNAPGAELGVQLYLRTRWPGYLRDAKRMYDWVRGCMLTPDGLYWDHINRHGEIERTQWTYNQGTMIGAGVMLYQATGDRAYLDQAKFTADAALRAYGPRELDPQPDYFTSIYIRNLLLLGSVTGDVRYREFAERFAAQEWNDGRDERHGLFNGHDGTEQLLDQACMVQIYAMLVSKPWTYF